MVLRVQQASIRESAPATELILPLYQPLPEQCACEQTTAPGALASTSFRNRLSSPLAVRLYFSISSESVIPDLMSSQPAERQSSVCSFVTPMKLIHTSQCTLARNLS